MSAEMVRRQSKAALWCQRIAVFLIPYFIVVIAGQRWKFIDTPSVFGLLGLGILLILLVLALGGIGLHQLWQYGDKGGMQSVRGIVLGLIISAPYVWFGWHSFTLPPLHDITTDKQEPPAFEAAVKFRTPEMNEINVVSTGELELQQLFYPQIVSRRYPTSPDRVYSAVVTLMGDLGWRIVGEDIPEEIDRIDIEGSARKRINEAITAVPSPRPENPLSDVIAPEEAQEDSSISSGENGENQIGEELSVTYVEAVSRSLIMGFTSDVVVRIVEEDQTTLVDMRSSSRWGPHDLGSNAARITGFLRELDNALAGIAGEG